MFYQFPNIPPDSNPPPKEELTFPAVHVVPRNAEAGQLFIHLLLIILPNNIIYFRK